jgi:hypothetical protein
MQGEASFPFYTASQGGITKQQIPGGMMSDALQIFKFSLKDFWEEFVLLVILNLVWSLAVIIPVAPLFALREVDVLWALGLSLLLLLPLPIVSGGLCFVTNQISRGKAIGWRAFLVGIRCYWSKSLIVALINLVVAILILTNIQFYGVALEGTWTTFAVGLWLIIGAYWLLVQVFWFPMILELESEKILLALRNALAMAVISPGFSLTLAVLLVLVIALCIVLTVPALIFMASFSLLVFNHATRSRLAMARKIAYEPGVDLDQKTEPQGRS